MVSNMTRFCALHSTRAASRLTLLRGSNTKRHHYLTHHGRLFSQLLNGQVSPSVNIDTTTVAADSNEKRTTTTQTKDTDNSSNDASDSTDSRMRKGIVLDHSINLQKVRPGDQLDIPYEMTLSETLQDFWFAAFFDQSRIHTSRPFCRKMGLQDRVMPFSLALFLASSMSHADAAKVQVGFGKVTYQWPLFAGDTIHKRFTVQKIRPTSDGHHNVIHFICDLYNQRNRLCMRADKRMLFPMHIPTTTTSSSSNQQDQQQQQQQYMNVNNDDNTANDSSRDRINKKNEMHLFRDHLVSKGTTVLAELPSHSWTRLEPGMVILHRMHRSLTFAQSQQLASIARLTHARHFDTRRYDRASEILIPGGLVLGLALSESARDLHEILHEEIQSCSYVNALHPENIVGAISYVAAVDESLPGDLEVATVRTLGIKNLNVPRDLDGLPIPLDLFEPGLFTKEIEQICKNLCPELSGKIVVQAERKILRQTARNEVFLL